MNGHNLEKKAPFRKKKISYIRSLLGMVFDTPNEGLSRSFIDFDYYSLELCSGRERILISKSNKKRQGPPPLQPPASLLFHDSPSHLRRLIRRKALKSNIKRRSLRVLRNGDSANHVLSGIADYSFVGVQPCRNWVRKPDRGKKQRDVVILPQAYGQLLACMGL